MTNITQLKPKIKVIGVGGCGGNILNNIIPHFPDNANDFIACNTDAQALEDRSIANIKIQLGLECTKGLGAGGMPKIGAESAHESINEIMEHVKGVDMVFLIAGMGGGTGTGATPIIAEALRNLGVLVFTIVTEPFMFEGAERARIAAHGIENSRNKSDALLVISNQKLFTIINPDTSLNEAFLIADTFFVSAVRNIMDLIQKPGLINVDFADVKTSMNDMIGNAVFGTGEASNEDNSGYGRAVEAAEMAVQCPLISETSIKSAKCLLINITGGNDLKLFEVDAAVSYITAIAKNARVIFGTVFDKDMEGSIRISFIATGIENENNNVIIDEKNQNFAKNHHESIYSAMESSAEYTTVTSSKNEIEFAFENFVSDKVVSDKVDSTIQSEIITDNAIIETEKPSDKLSFFEKLIGKKKKDYVENVQKSTPISRNKSLPKFLDEDK
ncbi:cell division protein FtsZ [Candidatus Gromoviella agglomerans]|uniref:cell division protein FtsZ n=1 Tax=Candidatus Gromoviella agglomerans TaxID=2806609 RepID=UPI001E5E3CF7|nr:cell division protein FtsZ [Candidatus Gromoviella agglomerans]UFX98208.1 Cell division protein FtsZ [Candidatus Gromoviella agglomerans]